VCGTPVRLASGSSLRLGSLPPDLPTKTLPRRCSLATSRYERSTVGPVLGSKSINRFSAQRTLRARCRFILLPPSMKRDAFQLFVIKSLRSLSSSAFASPVATSWLFIEFLVLDFHILLTRYGIDMNASTRSGSIHAHLPSVHVP
jgi:hypothetical protein